MTLCPRIESPCPHADRLSEIIDGGLCRICDREVHDLTAMDDAARWAFLAARQGEVCISYKAPLRIALAAMAASAALATPLAAAACDPTETVASVVVVGAIKDPAHTRMVQDAQDAKIPALPVVYDDARPPAPPATADPAAPHQATVDTSAPDPAKSPLKTPASS
jgi:hypothetical protein